MLTLDLPVVKTVTLLKRSLKGETKMELKWHGSDGVSRGGYEVSLSKPKVILDPGEENITFLSREIDTA